MEKILAVSIAAYNAENDIAHCLDSFLKTSVADKLEIIVVNDGSKDRTADIVNGYVEAYPDIVRLVDKENGGHGSTINVSISEFTAKYYKIVDSDDFVDRVGLEKLVNWLENNEVDIVFNPFYEIDSETKSRKRTVFPCDDSHRWGYIDEISKIKNVTLYMHSITLKKNVAKKMGAVIDENCFYVDAEYVVFAMAHVSDYSCLDFPVYEYMLGTAEQSMNINNMISRRDQHLQVVKCITDFYDKNKFELNNAVKSILLTRIQLAVMMQYKIYASMKDKSSTIECREFDKWVRRHKDVSYGMKGRLMSFVKINRAFNFKLFQLSVFLLHFF